MKEVKHYICEMCGTEYNDKKKAQECEIMHKKPVKILNAKYLPITSNKLGTPKSIIVEFDDGSQAEYKR